jgi:mono/diheme cytochrome c family protein
MKKIFSLAIIALVTYSCNKKMSPSKPPVPLVVEVPAVKSNKVTDPVMLESGKNLFVANCGKCHDLPVPAHYNSERWVSLVNWMAPKAKLTESEKAQVLYYVQNNAPNETGKK